MRKGFVMALILLGTSACASNGAQTPAIIDLSPATAADDECYCNVRKRQQVKARLEKKKQLDPDED